MIEENRAGGLLTEVAGESVRQKIDWLLLLLRKAELVNSIFLLYSRV